MQDSPQNQKVLQAIDVCTTVNGVQSPSAAGFLVLIAQIARQLDDVQDSDNGPVDIAIMAQRMLVELPYNPFYAQHGRQILPIMEMALNAWADANEWEQPPGELESKSKDVHEMDLERATAFVIRDQIIDVALMVARIVGGPEHLRRISLRVRELFAKPQEWRDLNLIKLSTSEI